ncbi:MAG TPA: MFS transporter [Ktedonobacterales bacterium]|nr:MFS transporter [Ktedonobacterales bacterium]
MDTITATDAPSTPKPGLFINRNFALLWTGGAISVFGDVIFDTSLIVWISVFLAAHQSWAPLAVSGVLLATLVPTFAFGPIAGVFVDRWDKRRTMLWMDATRAILIALLLLATNILPLPFLPGGRLPLAGQLAAIYTVVFLASLCAQLFSPARLALIGDIVAAPQQARASSMSQMTQSLAFLIAPPLAPILLLAVGPQIALLINALSFACSFATLLAVRAPRAATSRDAGERPNFLREFAAGLKFSVQNRVILTLLITTSVIMLGASALNALDIFFVRDNLHAPLNLYGFLETAQGVGAILGAVLTSMLAKKIGLARLLIVSLFLLGLCLLVYSRLSSLVPALIVIFSGGIVVAAANILAGPLLLRVTPRAYIGRVVATITPTSAVMQVLGTVFAGFLASNVLLGFHGQALGLTFGPIDTIFTGGALLALVGAIYALVRLGFTDPPAVTAEAPDTTTAAPLVETAAAG